MNNRYEKYKDSGIEWIGEIPENWEISRVKNAFIRKKEKAKQENPTILSLTSKGIVVRDITFNEGQIAESYFNYNPVEIGDLLLNPMDLVTNAFSSVANDSGVISPAYFNLKNKKEINSKYFDYYFKLQYWNKSFFAHGKGVSWEHRWTLNQDTLMNFIIPVPSEPEQTAIANYLDKKTVKIDELIVKKQKLIELLKEDRTAIINQAITKGINPDVKLKPSGIDWLGDIPEHWTVKKISHLSNVTKLTGFEYSNLWETSVDGDIIALRGYNIREGYLDINTVERISKELSSELIRSKLFKNDIVYPCTGTIGNAAIIDEDDKYHINQNIAKITPNNLVYPKYLLYSLLSFSIKSQIHFNNSSQMQPVILIGELRQIKISLSSDINEQIRIIDELENQLKKNEGILTNVENEIDFLYEYRKALIGEVVTGKLRVC